MSALTKASGALKSVDYEVFGRVQGNGRLRAGWGGAKGARHKRRSLTVRMRAGRAAPRRRLQAGWAGGLAAPREGRRVAVCLAGRPAVLREALCRKALSLPAVRPAFSVSVLAAVLPGVRSGQFPDSVFSFEKPLPAPLVKMVGQPALGVSFPQDAPLCSS